MEVLDILDSAFNLKEGVFDKKLTKKCMQACQKQTEKYMALRDQATAEMNALMTSNLQKYIVNTSDIPTAIHNIAMMLNDSTYKKLQPKLIALSQKHVDDVDDLVDCVLNSCDKQVLRVIYDIMIIISGIYDILSSKEMKRFLTDVFKHVQRHQLLISQLLQKQSSVKGKPQRSCITACLETSKKFNKRLSDLMNQFSPLFMMAMMMIPDDKPTIRDYLHDLAAKFEGKKSHAATVVKLLMPILEFVREKDLGIGEIVECFLTKCDSVSLQIISDVVTILQHIINMRSDKQVIKAYDAYMKIATKKRQDIIARLGKKL